MNAKTKRKYWVGFDLGGTKMLAALYDNDFYQLSRQRERTRGAKGADAGLTSITKLIRATVDETKVELDEIAGICIGCPGPLNLDEGVIIEAPNLGWKDVQVKKKLEKELGCPVAVVNDVDAGVYGEYCFGAARDARCVVGVFPGTGIGGGCVYDGRIVRGATSSCMEIGHIQVLPGGPLCGCGRHGCLEAVASRLAIASQVAAAAYRGNAPSIKERAGTNLSDIRSGALANAIKSGDEVVKAIIEDAAGFIGVAVANLVCLLSPEVIVLGGGMVEAMPELFVKNVQKAADNQVMPSFVGTFQVVAAKLGDDAAIMGTAAWAKSLFS